MQSNSSTITTCQSRDYTQNSDEIIHVVLSVYDPSGTYSQHAGVVMTSIFENTKSKVTVHILHDDTLTEENRQRFIRTAEKYSQSVQLISIEHQKRAIVQKIPEAAQRITPGALYRLLAYEVIDVRKLIYLDCDIIVNLDIAELWGVDLNGKTLAAVKDPASSIGKFSARGLMMKLAGCNIHEYFNAGVLVMDLDRIRSRKDFTMEAISWLFYKGDLAPSVDQDALNSIFRGDVKFIAGKFNNYKIYDDVSDSIIHFWASKPWSDMQGLETDRLYWKMFLRSAWGENLTPEEVADVMNDMAYKTTHSAGSKYHRSGKDCIRRLVRSVQRRIAPHVGIAKYFLTRIRLCFRRKP